MKKVLFGILSIFPSILILLTITISFYISTKVSPDDMIPVEYRVYVIVGLILMFISVLAELGLIIGYLIHIFSKNKHLTDSSKIVWTLCIWFLNIFIIPVYWYKFVLKE